MSRFLTSKVPGYLLRLRSTYDRNGDHVQRDIIDACKFLVTEDVSYDNWNGGTYGHDVTLYLPLEEILKIDIDDQSDISKKICGDMNKLANSEAEFFQSVHLEMDDENDTDYQRATPFSARPRTNPDSLSFWKPKLARVFISHRDQHKTSARALSDALEPYGISCFVAHDTIQPMNEWRTEIMKGLETMEVMLVYLTDDFEDSIWCHQEVGFALGKGVPIISLKLGRRDPPGFISHVQAMRGNIADVNSAALGLFPLIGKSLGRQSRLQEALVNSFVTSPSWSDARDRFDRMEASISELTEQQVRLITDSFHTNDQLYNSAYLTNRYQRLKHFLEKTTRTKFLVEGTEIKEAKVNNSRNTSLDDEIPF